MFNKVRKIAQQSGFTGIELLMVLVIVIIVAVLVTNNIQQANAKARDLERRSDINAIHDALEDYWHLNEAYPGDLNGVSIDEANTLDPSGNSIIANPAEASTHKPVSSYAVDQPQNEYTYAPYNCEISQIDHVADDQQETEIEEDPIDIIVDGCQQYVLYSWLEVAEENATTYERTNSHNLQIVLEEESPSDQSEDVIEENENSL
ncbi:MAG: hypothetical protein OXF85_00455 [Candidatus Saccharibacteria bacterium]|nr:hypothetical protein [Candidatus Saccharibacteria bacterium]MCY4088680.1 hypothetical protein [Candidatus Saccharibacteria bacterium]